MTANTATIADVEPFVEAVFEPADLVELRLVPSGQSTWHRADALPAETLLRQNNADQHVYVGANPRRARGVGVKARGCTKARQCGRCARCVALARCLFVDFDDVGVDEARQRIRDADLPGPTVLIASGGGVHAYWRLSEPLSDLTLWSVHQRKLIEVLHADPSIHDAPRIMRLPGFVNHKPKYNAPVCRIVECDPERTYSLDEFPGRSR